MKISFIILMVSSCLLNGMKSYCQPGALDTYFSYNGSDQLYFYGSGNTVLPSEAKSLLINGNGKLIVVGSGEVNGSPARYLNMACYNDDGLLDTTFGYKGVVQDYTGIVFSENVMVNGAALQSDGKILVAGTTNTSDRYIFLARYLSNGRVDPEFGDLKKRVLEAIGPGDNSAQCIAQQADSKIVVAGYQNASSSLVKKDFFIARYTSTGKPDNFFHLTGKLIRDIAGQEDQVNTMVIQPDQKILVAGTSNYNFFVARYNSDGSEDNTFGTGGLATTDLGGNDYGRSMTLQPDGKILVCGYTATPSGRDFALVRYNKNGTLDNTFSSDGKVTLTIDGTSDDLGQSVALQKDGKIVVAGNYYKSSIQKKDVALVRFNSNGSPDTNFGFRGIIGTHLSANEEGYSVAIQQDGKIVVAGTAYGEVKDKRFLIARYFSGLEENKPDTMEAEAAELFSAAVATNRTGYIGSGFVDYLSPTRGYIKWTIGAAKAGPFSLVFRYANGSTADRPLNLIVNNISLGSQPFAPTGGWNNWKTISVNVNLVPGRNVIQLSIAGSEGPNIDQLAYAPVIITPTGILEAEQAVLNGPVIATNRTGYTGTGFADYVNVTNDYIEWTVNAPNAGLYSLNFRYANGASTNRPLQLKVNGTTTTASLAFAPTGAWTTWKIAGTPVTLLNGINKIRLTTIGTEGPNVDHLAYAPYVAPVQNGTLEAELAVLSGAKVASNYSGFSGTGFADYINASGDYIEWTINASAEGSFQLKFRYANGSIINRLLKLQVNGVTANSDLAFPSTTSWTNWLYSSKNVSLSAGANTIRVTTNFFNGPNIDRLEFSNASAGNQSVIAEENILSASSGIFKVTVAPNPVRTKARMQVFTSSTDPISVDVIDVLGIHYKTIKFPAGSATIFDFSVEDFVPGVYTLLVKQGNVRSSTRLIIMRK